MEALWDHRPRKLLSDWRPLGQSWLLPFVVSREKGASPLQPWGPQQVACVLTMGTEDKHQALVVFAWTPHGPQIIAPYYPKPVYQSHFDQTFY